MNERITILDIDVNDYTAKHAMKQTMQYMQTEVLNVIEVVTADTLMYAKEEPKLKEDISKCDLILPGEKEILEAANVTEKRHLQEVEACTYLKLFLHYLHKNHFRVYLLVENEQEEEELCRYLKESYKGIQIAGAGSFDVEKCSADMITNAVNGSEVDWVISALASPFQESFVIKNRNLLNARVWLGAGKLLHSFYKNENRKGRFMKFIVHRIFKHEIEKNRKEMQLQG